MECQQCCSIDSVFNQKVAMKELKTYQEKGSSNTTKILINELSLLLREKESILDIGGGIGAISHELSRIGLSTLINVDASRAYLKVAQAEAERLEYINKASFYFGDFVEISSEIPPTDVVTLDKVLCCYPDMSSLVARSIEKSKDYYGIIHPRESWWVKLGIYITNSFQRFKRSKYRSYVHEHKAIHDIIHSYNFKQIYKRNKGVWVVEIFRKVPNTVQAPIPQ